jgi:predicted RNase H-like nuclease
VSRIAGIVGCKAGWFVLRETPLPGPWHWFVAPTFEEAMQRLENYEVVAVDIPLSMTEMQAASSDKAKLSVHERYRRPVDKIRQVQEYIRANPGSPHFLYEVHPRLSFLELEGGVMLPHREKRKLRFRDRLSYLLAWRSREKRHPRRLRNALVSEADCDQSCGAAAEHPGI